VSGIRNKIKRLRKRHGWTQDELAKKAKLHRVSLAQIEIGRRKNPDLLTRKKLAKALGVDIRELLD
jgi:transcriptional regulator with XRE-family HTH domain